jgi:putative DNA primase/helicase
MKRGPGDAPETPGYAYEISFSDRSGEWHKWLPGDYRLEKLDQDAVKRWQEQAKAKRDAAAIAGKRKNTNGRKNAKREWEFASEHEAGGIQHSRILDYLAARGIPIEPADAPRSLAFCPLAVDRWDESAKEWLGWPGICARVLDASGEQCGLHVTYLDPQEPKKRQGEEEPRKKFGPCGGGAVRLIERDDSRVLIVGEGIETTYSVGVAAGFKYTTWAALDAVSLANLQFPEEFFARGKGVHTVLIVADLDANHVGWDHAVKLAYAILAKWPHVTVEILVPTHASFPELVEPDGTPKGKGVDWNDCTKAKGLEAVYHAFFGSLRLGDAQRRADSFDPENPAPPISVTRERARGDDEEYKIMPAKPIEQAMLYLAHQEMPVGVVDTSRAHTIKRWQDSFWEYRDGCYHDVSDEIVRSKIVLWASRDFLVRKGRGDKARLEPFIANDKAVANIVKDVAALTQVRSDTAPCRLPRVFNDAGEPDWAQVNGFAKPVQNLVAFRDGLLALDSWQDGVLDVLPHSERVFTLAILPYDLDADEFASSLAHDGGQSLIKQLCPNWLAFLGDVSNGSQAWVDSLQEWFGYSLTPARPHEKILVIQGPTRSGKGTIDTVWRAMLGDANVGTTSFNSLGQRFHLATLVGKLLAVMSDAHITKKTDATQAVELLKAISGGDAVQVETKFSPNMPSVRLACKVVIFCNEPPSMPDSSGALGGRLHVLPMMKSYSDNEDLGLKVRLAKETRGVMLWALLGLRRLWQQGKLTIPPESVEAKEDFKRTSSPIYAFVVDHCERKEGVSTWTSDLYAAYRAWGKANGHSSGSITTLSRQLKGAFGTRVFVSRFGDKSARKYDGIRIAVPPPGYQPVLDPTEPIAGDETDFPP